MLGPTQRRTPSQRMRRAAREPWCPGRTGCSRAESGYSCGPRRGLRPHTAAGQRGEKPSESRAPQVGRCAHFPPLLRPASPPPPTCAGAGRRKGHRPALPPPTGPEQLPEAPRETAALRPRNAMAAHGVALCPQSRRPAANGPPNAKSSIPHVRSGDGPRCAARREPRRPALHPTAATKGSRWPRPLEPTGPDWPPHVRRIYGPPATFPRVARVPGPRSYDAATPAASCQPANAQLRAGLPCPRVWRPARQRGRTGEKHARRTKPGSQG